MLHAHAMREVIWIPSWLGEWADRNGNFRNFPVFAAFAALLFLVFSVLPFAFHSALKLKFQPFSFRTALRAAVCASALGVLLEVAQLLFLPTRHFDWADIGWSTSGAFVGATVAAAYLGKTRNRQHFHYLRPHNDSLS
jgi:threonine/homoserine efflux transporter RhtA